MAAAGVLDVTEETFQRDVLDRSAALPVVVDFWASWCGPCRTLGPLLERLAGEAAGSWVLAKVDVDANPGLASAFRVQGIPAVHAFRDGREVARFVGALPEQQVRAWLTQLGPTEADRAVEDGRAAEERGDLEAAATAYRRALTQEPGNAEARAALARVELAARVATLDAASMNTGAPGNVEEAIARADLAFARGDVAGATDVLLPFVRAGGSDRDRARAHLVALLETLSPDDARALAARRALASALY